MDHLGFVYIMTNKNRTTLYIGVTNNLCRRIREHKNHLISGSFTDRYNLEYCIYYEEYPYFELAIQREKELKKWNRQKKENLINQKNQLKRIRCGISLLFSGIAWKPTGKQPGTRSTG
jgi:putative endonuclease